MTRMLWRLSGSLQQLVAGGSARDGGDGVVELIVNADEASLGGVATISMRVPIACPTCSHGDRSDGACPRCGDTRAIEELFSAWLTLPAGVGDGTVLEPSVLLPGMLRPPSFRVRVAARKESQA